MKTWNFPGKTNMAIDVVLAEIVDQPLLRLYTWARPTLSVGRHQKRIELNLDYMKRKGIDCVIRPTGGRAVLHWDELTYAFMVPASHVFAKKGLEEFHKTIGERIFLTLRRLDFPVEMSSVRRPSSRSSACFESASLYEITLNGKKLVGSAQMRTKDFVLEHGSILLRTHIEEYAHCLNLNPDSLKDKLIGLEEVKNITLETLADSLVESFAELFGPIQAFSLNCEHLSRVYQMEGLFSCPAN